MRRKGIGNNKKIVALDFFCGCGGATHGMQKAGIEVLAGFDNDPDVKFAYEKNNEGSKFYKIDLAQTSEVQKQIELILKELEWDILLFAACAPCQPFSRHTPSNSNDSRRSLLIKFMNIVEKLPHKLRPSFILCENVSSMRSRGKDVLGRTKRRLYEMNYQWLEPKIINAADFEVPQNRKRLIFIAAKKTLGKGAEGFRWDYF